MCYSVYSAGPTLGGRVAVFDSQQDAEEYCSLKNSKSMFSSTSNKDEFGISKAWKMGDGQYWYREEYDLPDNFFEWS